MDPVMGVDIHIIMIPTPAGPVPTPIPHPFIGMVIDPMDYVPIVGATVIVNGMPVGVAGTGAKNIPPHIPMGGPFGPPPPGNEGEIFMGSATVLADGEPFSSTGLPVLSCNAFGSPAPPRAKKGGAKSLMLPTSVVLSVPMGMPVMVGGPPTISMMGMAMKFGMAAFKKFRKLQKKAGGFWDNLSKKLNKKADDVLGETGKARNAVRKGICFVTGHPVDIPTGKVFTDKIDFELPGPIPLVWERTWYSTSQYAGPLGYGWHHNYDWAIIPREWEGQLEVRMGDGRYVSFPSLEVGESSYNRQDKLTLFRDEKGYFIRNERYEYYRFDESRGKEWPLIRISNDSGQQVTLSYDEFGALTQIVDCCGRVLSIETDFFNRITAIHGPHPDKEGETFIMMRYAYDDVGDMVKTWDALDHDASYAYANHLLVRETDRNGLSFYFEYDGVDHNAKCIHTWGDGGIYDHKLTYAGGITFVENSLGHTKTYHHNEALVTKEVDAKGNATLYEYNEFYETLAEVDALDRRTEYAYDQWGNRVKTVFPDETEISQVYEEHKLVMAIDPMKGKWKWRYDETHQVISKQDCMGAEHLYKYSKDGKLHSVINPKGELTSFLFDEKHNLTQLTTPDNATRRWEYDQLGRNRGSINPKGNVQRRIFDLGGNLIQVDEADGNRCFLGYDPEGNLIQAKDKIHQVQFTYKGMGRVQSREENGNIVSYIYNTEENLIGIRNEHDQVYSFDLDENGKVEIESGYDGIKRFYQRDKLGRVRSVIRVSGVETFYEYDQSDRIVKISHFENNQEISSENYLYRADGELVEAWNSHSRLKFERDLIGRITKEWQGDHWITSSYDIQGLRTQFQSSLGASLHFAYNSMGQVEAVSSLRPSGLWEARFKRDLNGLEMGRTFTGGINAKWERDQLGRPIEQQIFAGGGNTETHKIRRYAWDLNNRLKSLQIDGEKPTQFGYDKLGDLSWARYENGEYEYRVADEVGNIFKNPGKTDRKFGPSGSLLEAEGRSYQYDEEGNLIAKIEENGSKWIYEWEPSGMLSKVKRPDGKSVAFTYDPLGRRLSKSFDGNVTHWIWNGNVPLHEWVRKDIQYKNASEGEGSISFYEKRDRSIQFLSSNEKVAEEGLETKEGSTIHNPVSQVGTWIFEPNKFTPLAKFVDGKNFQVITDHLGTPIAMYDHIGNTKWAGEVSIYGEMRNVEGNLADMPFRYPGQYEDVETGLYYNRYRYYDPQGGQYISQDPIRIAGSNPNIYAYVRDTNILVDILGLDPTMVNPNDVNFSQRTVSSVTSDGIPIEDLTKSMEDHGYDLSKGGPLDVMEVDGQLVSYDNRRLLAAQNAGLDEVPINIVDPDAVHPDSTTGKTWKQKFDERRKHKKNRQAGGVVPEKGLKSKPKCV